MVAGSKYAVKAQLVNILRDFMQQVKRKMERKEYDHTPLTFIQKVGTDDCDSSDKDAA